MQRHDHHRDAHEQPDVVAENDSELLGARTLHEAAVAVHSKVEEGDQEQQGENDVVTHVVLGVAEANLAKTQGKGSVVGRHHADNVERPEQQAAGKSGQLHDNTPYTSAKH